MKRATYRNKAGTCSHPRLRIFSFFPSIRQVFYILSTDGWFVVEENIVVHDALDS